MEEHQERKFVCKYCFKSYPCGKSLGGHIRTHTNGGNNSAAQEVVEEADFPISKLFSKNSDKSAAAAAFMAEAGAQTGYGLRENPKKTKRFVDASGKACNSPKEMFCKECGKGFQSLKALCGHMACHSDKDRVGSSKIEDEEKQKLIMDSQSDTETSAPNRRRRSRRMRFKTVGAYSNSGSLANNNSSSASGVEQEQEELAKCLMMLSRDSGGKRGLNSVADSSENNSVVLEAKSSSIDLRITIKNGMKCISNDAEFVDKHREHSNLKSADFTSSSEDSDSGYFRNGPKKVESDVSVDGFLRNVNSSKRKFESSSGFEDMDGKYGKSSLSKYNFVKSEHGKNLDENGGGGERATTKYDLRRSGKRSSYTPEALYRNSQKGINRKLNGSCESVYESDADSLETDSYPVKTADTKTGKFSKTKTSSSAHASLRNANPEKRPGLKKSKGHECPFCSRVFKSGQALGGHKRSHFLGTSEDRTLVIKQGSAEMAGLIDLNLPAPAEEDTVENAGFMRW